jgi:hypothetical protein
MLYQAPIGHGLHLSGPDTIAWHRGVYTAYVHDLAATLGGGQLTPAQATQIDAFLNNQINWDNLPSGGDGEASAFRMLAVAYGYPGGRNANGYAPEDAGAVPRDQFAPVGRNVAGLPVPSLPDLNALLQRIACSCGRH